MPKISASVYRERRENILQAAREAFAKDGIHISVEEVCRTAGVSKGAFYGYFRSKDALFEALAEAHGANLSNLQSESGAQFLQRMIEDRASINAPDFAKVELETWSYALRHPGLKEIFIGNTDRVLQALERALAGVSGDDAETIRRNAAILQLAVQGAFLSMALKGETASEETRSVLKDLLSVFGLKR